MGFRKSGRATRLRFEACESRLLLTVSVIFDPHEIDITSRGSVGQARSAFAADVDSDGDLDVVSVAKREGTIAWHENIDGAGTFRAQRFTISNAAIGADAVIVEDVDGDGDSDVIYASARTHLIAWHENLGDGQFDGAKVIATSITQVNSIVAADVDHDGDMDVLSASPGNNTIAWHQNLDGSGTFASPRVITDEALHARSVYVADLDGDGDSDVLSASARDDTVAWHENLDGIGTFGIRRLISVPNVTESRANFVSAADLDGDGDLDVLTASYLDDVVSWYENLDGIGTFGNERPIMVVERDFSRVDSVCAADVDSDGDLDVVSAGEFGHRTYWSENTDGLGAFGERRAIGPRSELTGGSFRFADLDNDGDPDILAASDHEGIIAWHENRLIGDSNDDGVFDTGDLVQVFSAAEYRDGTVGNSTFEEGDWNLDGDFDTSDLILAFQAGTYRSAASALSRELAAAVQFLQSDEADHLARAFVV